MSPLIYFIIGLILGLFIGFIMFYKGKTHVCNGSIVMHGDELYLCLTHEDKKAFETCRYATIRLEREKFHGFSET